MQDHDDSNETDYLLNNPVNAARLAESIDEIEAITAKQEKSNQ
ncbi:MAG: hypothetical protein K0R66_266 [Gammaproteobacteria bacterium]|jgi:PHD/YefM family antitoxin component YafN of YafNO toxin-antitoxin module|nr:hypothetical protein [Gammaproteobacteria bacterium]